MERWLRSLPHLGFLLVLASIWLPELSHYYVRTSPLSEEIVRESRVRPPQALLDEIGRIRMLHPWRSNEVSARALAEGDAALRGEYETADGTRMTFAWPITAPDVDRGPASWQLEVAAFAIPDRLLKAYEASGKAEYLEKAVEFAVEWDAFEAAQWLPRGLAWNDHAIAERAYVLTDLWRAYRVSPAYDPARGETILRLNNRAAELLARPSHFTFATNHGVMQNLALMQVALAMPLLPDAARYFATGKDRLELQLAYYVSPDGVILEHSAGYHWFGMQLLSVARRYFEIAGQPPPELLVAAIHKGARFSTELTRPGGSLPLIGDTHAKISDEGASRNASKTSQNGLSAAQTQSAPPPESCLIMPTSGYAILWNGLAAWSQAQQLSQLVAAWSWFPGHAHKHADELSVLFWAAGRDWITSAGYWAYDHPGRDEAASWQGSNAPHALDESAQVARQSLLKGAACGDGVAALDMERTTQEGLRIRRQIVQASHSVWLVLDSSEDSRGRPLVTDWTLFPGLQLESGPLPNSFRAMPGRGDATLDLVFAGSAGMRIRPTRGSATPFAGWVYGDSGPIATPALIVDQPKPASWTATIWILHAGASAGTPVSAPTVAWRSDESWEVSLALSSGPLQLVRDGTTIRMGDHDSLTLAAPPASASADRARIEAAFNGTQHSFPKYRDLTRYRYRATYLVLALYLLELGVVFTRLRTPLNAAQLRWILTSAWVVLGLWLNLYYFAH